MPDFNGSPSPYMPGSIPWLDDDDDPAPEHLRRPTVQVTERGRRLLALLRCRELLPASSTTVAAVLDRRIDAQFADVNAD